MPDTPESGANVEDESANSVLRCPSCGTPISPSELHCPQCGNRIPTSEYTATIETAHIAYLLLQIPQWRQRGLISAGQEQALRAQYSAISRINPPPVLTQALPAQYRAQQNAWELLDAAERPAAAPRSEQIGGIRAGDGIVQPGVDARLPEKAMERTKQQGSAVLSRLLQEHGIKALFALATLFVLAALRSILAWDWINTLAMRLLPCLPIWLTGMFWWFGRKTRSSDSSSPDAHGGAGIVWAAVSYDSLAVILSAFSVFSVNSYWLQHALPMRVTLLSACTVSVSVAGSMLASRRTVSYLHLFQAAAQALLYALLQMLRYGRLPNDLRPDPALLFGFGYMAYAVVCLIMAHSVQKEQKAQSASATTTADWRNSWTLWAYIEMAIAIGLAALAAMLHAAHTDDFYWTLLTAGLITLAGAQWLQSEDMVWLSFSLLVGGPTLWLLSAPDWPRALYFTFWLLALTITTQALAAFNSRRAADELMGAFRQAGKVGLVLATGLVWLDTLSAGTPFLTLNRQDYTLWVALAALTCGAVHAWHARQEQETKSVYVAVVCAGEAAALLTWRLLPAAYASPLTCLTPFLLIVGGISLWRSLRGTGDSAAWALWDRPIIQVTLGALYVALADGAFRLISGTPLLARGVLSPLSSAPHQALLLLAPLLSALLLALSRRERNIERQAALWALCAASFLLTAALYGLPEHGIPLLFAKLNLFALCSAALGWAWWLTALALRRRTALWSDDIADCGLALALVSALLLVFASGPAPSRVLSSVCFIFGLGGAFTLCALDSAVRRRTASAWLAVAVLAGIAVRTAYLSQNTTPVGALWLLIVFFAASVFVALARRLDIPNFIWLSLVTAGGGLCIQWINLPEPAHRALLINRVICALGGGALAWVWLRAAWWTRYRTFAVTAGIASLFAWQQAAALIRPSPHAWIGLLLLPAIAAMYTTATSMRRLPGFAPVLQEDEDVWERIMGAPLRITALALSVVALLWTAMEGDILFPTHKLVTLTLAIYGIGLLALAWRKLSPEVVAFGATFCTAAYLHLLLENTSLLLPPAAVTLSWPLFAASTAAAGIFLAGSAWRLLRSANRRGSAAPLLTLAGGMAILSALVGLYDVQTPNQGVWTLAALALCSAIWFTLWHLKQGEMCLHVGVWNLILGCVLLIYNRIGYTSALLDIYLMPMGIYLIVIGHISGAAAPAGRTQLFWWSGSLLLLVPSFLAAFNHVGGLHTGLFLLECTLSVAWGVVWRIRAFVGAGLSSAALFASALGLGYLQDVMGALMALGIGIMLFIIGFFVLTHRDTAQKWAASFERRWAQWR